MGQEQSKSGNNCDKLSDDEIVYRLRQYMTLNKIIDILLDVENESIVSITTPEKYLVDIKSTLYDLITENPSELTQKIFNPVSVVYGIHEGTVLTKKHTILHDYNNFILNEFKFLSTKERKNKAKDIREKVISMSNELMNILSMCNNIGNVENININNENIRI